MISVIIPSYNSEKTISKCLESLEAQSFKGELDIWVVDSSRDRTPEIITNCHPGVKLYCLEKRTDPGTARNIGIRQTEGNLIAFIDADCTAAPNWLEEIERSHRLSYDIVGGSVRNSPKSNTLVARAGYISEFRDFLPGKVRQEVMHIPTCNISYKRWIFREFGLFHGEYYPQEDLVFNYGLWRRGQKMLFDPGIQVWHQHRTMLVAFLSHQQNIGKATSKVLRTIPLEGAFLARRPLLAACLVPFMTLVKFTRTVRVFLNCQPKFIKKRPMVLAVFALGLISWAIGFVRSAHAKAAK